MSLVVLHGARKNVGDYLIRDRGVRLLRHASPGQEIALRPRWEPVPADARKVVLCGGPGLAADFYPGTFSLGTDLASLPPTRILALGWSGKPVGTAGEDFQFSEQSQAALRAISEHGPISVRDDITASIVRRADIGEVVRTGCVAWYDLDSLGKPLHQPLNVQHVAVTPPAKVPNARACLSLLRVVARRFPKAQRTCVFHRGIASRDGASGKTATANTVMAATARALGFKVIDAAYDLDKIDLYRHVDLHVGYRVHAHLAALSCRRPSVLISEDGRGLGQNATLGDPYGLTTWQDDPIPAVSDAIDRELSAFGGSASAVETIEASWPVMREFVQGVAA